MDLMAAFEQAARDVAAWRLDDAERQLEAILAASPAAAPRAWTELAVARSLQGRGAEALAAIDEAVRLAPLDATIRQNALILEKLREPEDPERFLAQHRLWGETFAPAGGCLVDGRVARQPGPIRIAYLGVDAHTALKRFVPILAGHHDRTRFQLVFCHGLADAAGLAEARARWPWIHHLGNRDLSPRAFARALALLETDIAIDLSGHGHGGTLEALAYRPAPIQWTWLDYVATTGVPSIDGRIADAVTDPDDTCSTETVHRLPFAQWCATLPPGLPDTHKRRAGAAPVLGLVNVTVKLSPRLLDLARRILEAVPDARLLVLGLTGQAARRHVLDQLPESLHARLDLHDRVDEATYHRLVASVDVALDPTVFSGATSTLDALMAGIPVLTCPGRLPHTRSTASILTTLDLHDWIAADDDMLVRTAANLLEDEVALRHWRRELPSRVRQSTLADGARFVAGLEDLYTTAWAAWEAKPESSGQRAQLAARANAAIAAGDMQAAVYALEALCLYPSPPKLVHTLAMAYNRLGLAWLQRGARFEARKKFEMALEIEPGLAEAQHNLGMC